MFEDAADVGQEAHVAHAVRFIQHQHIDAREIDVAFADVVEQAAGAGNDDFNAAAQSVKLRAFAHTAINRDAAHLGVSA